MQPRPVLRLLSGRQGIHRSHIMRCACRARCRVSAAHAAELTHHAARAHLRAATGRADAPAARRLHGQPGARAAAHEPAQHVRRTCM